MLCPVCESSMIHVDAFGEQLFKCVHDGCSRLRLQIEHVLKIWPQEDEVEVAPLS
jgi:hypothetical protein